MHCFLSVYLWLDKNSLENYSYLRNLQVASLWVRLCKLWVDKFQICESFAGELTCKMSSPCSCIKKYFHIYLPICYLYILFPSLSEKIAQSPVNLHLRQLCVFLHFTQLTLGSAVKWRNKQSCLRWRLTGDWSIFSESEWNKIYK